MDQQEDWSQARLRASFAQLENYIDWGSNSCNCKRVKMVVNSGGVRTHRNSPKSGANGTNRAF